MIGMEVDTRSTHDEGWTNGGDVIVVVVAIIMMAAKIELKWQQRQSQPNQNNARNGGGSGILIREIGTQEGLSKEKGLETSAVWKLHE